MVPTAQSKLAVKVKDVHMEMKFWRSSCNNYDIKIKEDIEDKLDLCSARIVTELVLRF
jgi:predicted GTPase